MNDWFRSWHGAPMDAKWRTIAKRAGVQPVLVMGVAWALMDRASQAGERGSIEGLDIETLADFCGCEVGDIERVIVAMHDKGVLTNGRFTAWERRQPKRERDAELVASGRLPLAKWLDARRRIFQRDGFRCTYCGAVEVSLHCDHVVPVSRGGSNEDDNLTTACEDCNLSKGSKLLADWRTAL